MPWPNQLGRKVDVTELAKVDLGDPRDPKWLNHTEWNYDFAGVNVQQALDQQGDKRAIVAHMWGMVEGTSSFLGIENCWMNLGAEPGSQNFLVYWDEDETRELEDANHIDKYAAGKTTRLLTASGVTSNNGTKSTPEVVSRRVVLPAAYLSM